MEEMMNYKDMWNELKKDLDQREISLKRMIKDTNMFHSEYTRLKNKLEGLQLARGLMLDIERCSR